MVKEQLNGWKDRSQLRVCSVLAENQISVSQHQYLKVNNPLTQAPKDLVIPMGTTLICPFPHSDKINGCALQILHHLSCWKAMALPQWHRTQRHQSVLHLCVASQAAALNISRGFISGSPLDTNVRMFKFLMQNGTEFAHSLCISSYMPNQL